MRFGNVLLACVLLSFSGGNSLTPQMAQVCYLFGLLGLACYFSLELVSDQRERRSSHVSSHTAEVRLSRRLRAERNVSIQNNLGSMDEPCTGIVESAMDSKAELDVYLGPSTQSTLSV